VIAARHAYVDAVVANFIRLPGTPCRPSRRDRAVAAALYERRIPRSVVWAALVLATTRRVLRGPARPKLAPVRTLHYFLPAIDEVLDQPLAPDYVAYLAAKIRPLVQEKERALASTTTATRRKSEIRVS